MAKKKSTHYVDNKKFLAAMTAWRKLCKAAEEEGEEKEPYVPQIKPKITQVDVMGKSFI